MLDLPSFFFFNDPPPTEFYTLSLHDALPIFSCGDACWEQSEPDRVFLGDHLRSEEHTSELQSRQYLVCRLLLEKKNKLEDPQQGAPLAGQHVAHKRPDPHVRRLQHTVPLVLR